MDNKLYTQFKELFWNNTPHYEYDDIVHQTDMIDISAVLIDCAKTTYGIDIAHKVECVLGKCELQLQSHSIKERPAYNIIHEAILEGKIARNSTIIEATSGNFGIALGTLTKLDLDVIVLVSRKLQRGVLNTLSSYGVKIIDLDIDICPAPGMKGTLESLRAEVMYNKIREDLKSFGYDISIYDKYEEEIHARLMEQDIINLAQLLAIIYGWFCPKQYDNVQNFEAHLKVTGPEIDNQLLAYNMALKDFEIVCTFGTGGTSYGLSEYMAQIYQKKNVHIVFPIIGQDVAGIRGRSKASGLRMYDPNKYKGVCEINFEHAKYGLQYFVERGYDIGESSALAIYAVIQMINLGLSSKFVIILPDGIQKYKEHYDEMVKENLEISESKAISNIDSFGKLLWIHGQYTLTEKGKKLLSRHFSINPNKILVPSIEHVRDVLEQNIIPKNLRDEIALDHILVVCRAGSTSFAAAKKLSYQNITSVSLQQGIEGIVNRYDDVNIEDILQLY